MAGLKGRKRAGAVAPIAQDAGQVADVAGSDDAQRASGSEGLGAQAHPGRAYDWQAAKSRLSALEAVSVPVCVVYWPEAVGELWSGVYGHAKIYQGEPLAVLSSGERVPL